MGLTNILMIVSVLLAPLFAVQASLFLERRRERRRRRFEVFSTLMSTRASKLAPEHIKALNMIDIEFAGGDRRSRDVVAAWKAYLDHLNTGGGLSPEVWTSRGDDMFVELVHTISVVLGYDFDKTHIRRTSYYPRGYGDAEQDQINIRRGVREVLEGKRVIPVWMHLAAREEKLRQEELSTSQELAQSETSQETPDGSSGSS